MYYGGIVDPNKAYSNEDLVRDSIRLSYSYPDFLQVKTAGLSAEERNILHITLGKGEKKILLCGAHHGREYLSAAFLMKMIEEYAIYYKNNMKAPGYDTVKLLNEVSLHFVPMVNPDGVAVCQKALRQEDQRKEIKNMKLIGYNYREWKANVHGVDLNRHYPCLWERLQTGVLSPASEGFKGYAPAKEPEVKTVMKLCMENEYLLAASFHTKGEEIYYADSLTNGLLPEAWPIAKKISDLTGYAIKDVSKDPSVFAGGFENWFRMLFKRCAFLIELTPYDYTGVPHDDSRFDDLVWKKARFTGLLLAGEAQNLPT